MGTERAVTRRNEVNLPRHQGLSGWTSCWRLLRQAFTDRQGWSLILVLTLLSAIFGLVQPWPMKVLVDNVLGATPLAEPLAGYIPGAGTPRGLLVGVVLASLCIFAINSVLEVFLTRAWIRVGQRLVYDVA